MTGDVQDMLSRLRRALPSRWFPDVAPVLDGLLTGLAQVASTTFALVQYARAQARIATASGDWLDLIATDFFGPRLLRRDGEADEAFRRRIRRELLRPRATRLALSQAIADLTGSVPAIFEPARPADTGSWCGVAGYGVAGGWGSFSLPFQCFVTVRRPPGVGIPGIPGYGFGGYGQSSGAYATLTMLSGVTDEAIYAAIAEIMPTAAIAWTHIAS